MISSTFSYLRIWPRVSKATRLVVATGFESLNRSMIPSLKRASRALSSASWISKCTFLWSLNSL